MAERINDNLINLACEVVGRKGRIKQIDFGDGTDYQGELNLYWSNGKFQAYLIVFSDPTKTQWREQEDEFESVKIRDVADWLRGWGFELPPLLRRLTTA